MTREMRNIDPLLQQQECFSEVREVFRRIKDVKNGSKYDQGSAVDNKRPVSFKLSKKLTENRRQNQYEVTEHVKNLASLQRRLSSMNNFQMRKKNENDPLTHPARFRKPGVVP